MTSNIKNILKRLEIEDLGRYENHFYVISLANSNEYARMYTKLDKNAINTGSPTYGLNASNNLEKEVHYFELEEDEITYNIFLIANYKEEDDEKKYYIRIGEK